MNLQNGFKSDEYFAINHIPHAWNQQEIDQQLPLTGETYSL